MRAARIHATRRPRGSHGGRPASSSVVASHARRRRRWRDRVDPEGVTMPFSDMHDHEAVRLTARELYALFDQLFPHGLAGSDVLAEIAPEGFERSPLLACFHPSVEQL